MAELRAGIFTYAWDLAAEGYDTALGRVAAAGLTAVNLACAYHAGKFLLPHNPRHRVYFAEAGALYFRPDLARYGRLRPRVSRFVADQGDPLADLDRACRGRDLEVVAWVVCLHNTWLGEQHPDCALWNAFGDPYVHSLTPAHPAVREYLRALLTDVVTRADVAAVELESPGYMGFLHNYHHELVGVPLDAAQRALLGLSFNPADLDWASKAGIDGERLRLHVAAALDAAWNGDPAPARQLLDAPELAAYLACRQEVVGSLLAELRDAIHLANAHTEVRLFAPPGPDAWESLRYDALPALADGALAGYAASDEDARDRARNLRAVMGAKPVYGMVRAIAPDTVDPAAQLGPRVAAWREAGVQGIDFYNYGLMTLPTLDAIGGALRARR